MKKEIIIISCIVIFIVVADVISQITTQKFFDEITEDLNNLEDKIYKQGFEINNLEDDIKNIENKWRNKYNNFACFIEHDELEKVQTQLISIGANVNVQDYSKSIEEAEKCKFILEHIKEKDSFNLINIF